MPPGLLLLSSAITGMRFKMLKFNALHTDSQPQTHILLKGATDYTCMKSKMGKA